MIMTHQTDSAVMRVLGHDLVAAVLSCADDFLQLLDGLFADVQFFAVLCCVQRSVHLCHCLDRPLHGLQTPNEDPVFIIQLRVTT